VGRRIYNRDGSYTDPSFPGFTTFIALTKSTTYGSLGPYELYDEKGRNMENLWQFYKVYERVDASVQKYSRYNATIIWDHPAEVHAVKSEDGKRWTITPEYFAWRQKGMNCKYAVRYPVGYNQRHRCLFSLAENEDGTVNPKPLKYIEARKAIYVPLYIKLVKEKEQFKELKERLERGESLLIIEVDTCHQESLSYYKEKYGVTDDFIQENTMLVTKENLDIMLNDEKHPFGHGYCLAMALLDIPL
jgi:hypothetical protein